MLDKLLKAEEQLARFEALLLIIFVLVMLALATYNVFYRNVLVPVQVHLLTADRPAAAAPEQTPPEAGDSPPTTDEAGGGDESGGFGGGFDGPDSNDATGGFGGGFGDESGDDPSGGFGGGFGDGDQEGFGSGPGDQPSDAKPAAPEPAADPSGGFGGGFGDPAPETEQPAEPQAKPDDPSGGFGGGFDSGESDDGSGGFGGGFDSGESDDGGFGGGFDTTDTADTTAEPTTPSGPEPEPHWFVKVVDALKLEWIDVILRQLVLIVGFFGAMLATVRRKHITIDALSKVIPQEKMRWITVFTNSLSTFVCLVLAVAGWDLVKISIEYPKELVHFADEWHFQMAFPIGFGLLGLHFAIRIVESVYYAAGWAEPPDDYESTGGVA